MKLTEIIDQEPLLISQMRKLMAKGDRIWFKGSFSLLQVKGIGRMIVDVPRTVDIEEYHGPAYDIKVHSGIGTFMTPDDAETKWTLVKSTAAHQGHGGVTDWELKRARNG